MVFLSLKLKKIFSSLFDNDQNGIWVGEQDLKFPLYFQKKLNKMEKNEIFGPIKSGAGVHIIKLEDIRGETIQTESQTLVQHILIKESEIRSGKQAKDLIDNLHERLKNGEENVNFGKGIF